jgi:hypothetical protein
MSDGRIKTANFVQYDEKLLSSKRIIQAEHGVAYI